MCIYGSNFLLRLCRNFTCTCDSAAKKRQKNMHLDTTRFVFILRQSRKDLLLYGKAAYTIAASTHINKIYSYHNKFSFQILYCIPDYFFSQQQQRRFWTRLYPNFYVFSRNFWKKTILAILSETISRTVTSASTTFYSICKNWWKIRAWKAFSCYRNTARV